MYEMKKNELLHDTVNEMVMDEPNKFRRKSYCKLESLISHDGNGLREVRDVSSFLLNLLSTACWCDSFLGMKTEEFGDFSL